MRYALPTIVVCWSLAACGGDSKVNASAECIAAGDAEVRVIKAEMGDIVSASDISQARIERLAKCTKAKYSKAMIACLKAAKSISNMVNCDLDEKERRTMRKASPDCAVIADLETRLTIKEMGGKIAEVNLRKGAIIKCMDAKYSPQAVKCLKAAKNLNAMANCQVDESQRKKQPAKKK